MPPLNPAHWTARRLPDRDEIQRRLERVFPEGIDHRAYLVRPSAASTVFVFLYAQAIEGVSESRVRPTMVTDMSNVQAAQQDLPSRETWHRRSLRPGTAVPADAWYSTNTREPIRDETIRTLVRLGAAREDEQIPPTSPRPRYQLTAEFSDLFDPALTADAVAAAAERWQEAHLSAAALARIQIVRRLGVDRERLSISLPQGGTRQLPAGPSTLLAKATVELFLPRFLEQPALLALAEGRRRLLFEDADLLRATGLKPDPRVMPDIIAADLAGGGQALILVLVELVATAGAMSQDRVQELSRWLSRRGHGATATLFGTAFKDRSDQAARAWAPTVAWGTFVWYVSEPEHVELRVAGGSTGVLRQILTTPDSASML